MAAELACLTVPRGLSREVTLYLQALQNMVMELGGLRGTGARAVRLAEALDWLNSGKALPETFTGFAADGETVRLGAYIARPLVIVAGFELPCRPAGYLAARIKNLRSDGGDWIFEALCRCVTAEGPLSGRLEYLAIGRRQYA